MAAHETPYVSFLIVLQIDYKAATPNFLMPLPHKIAMQSSHDEQSIFSVQRYTCLGKRRVKVTSHVLYA